MRIIMAVSSDGYVARGPEDDMSWLGPTDKKVFRILTGVGGITAASQRTAKCMPSVLHGRQLLRLSTKAFHGVISPYGWGTLQDFYLAHPEGWLLGGPTLAVLALKMNYVTEVHLCHSERSLPDQNLLSIKYPLGPWLNYASNNWEKRLETRIDDVRVDLWRQRRG